MPYGIYCAADMLEMAPEGAENEALCFDLVS